MSLAYLWPALAGLLYAVAAILTKRALAEGAGVARFSFVCNAIMFVLFLLPALTAWEGPIWSELGWPLLGGGLFFLGQLFTIAAIRVGDVSVQSPLMGSKVLFVAIISVATGAEAVPPDWWAGAGLTALAVFLLGFSNWRGGRRTWLGVGLALASAAAFAMCDVLVMAKAKSFGVANYLAVVMGVQLLLSFTLLPLFRQPLRAIPKTAWPWLLVAGAGMGVQAILMNIALGHYGNATAFNIIYSTRGLWSVLLIWVGGSLVGNIELRAAPGLIVRRMAGALLLLGAVALLLI